MTTALLYKEFRETLPIAALALVGFLLTMTSFGSTALPSYIGEALCGDGRCAARGGHFSHD